jgi:hypothetical protein
VDNPFVLNVKATDLRETARVGAIFCDELRHDRHGPSSVNREPRTTAVESCVAHAERIDVATVLVTNAFVAFPLVIVPTRGALALELSIDVAWVRCVRIRHAVCLPDIHFCAARTVMAHAHVVAFVFWVWLPIQDVRLAIDELYVMWALRIAVPSAELGARLVLPSAFSTILVHFNKIHCAIHTALDIGDVDVNGKLPVFQIEHHIFVIFIEHVEPRADIGPMLMFCHKPDLETSIDVCDAVSALILRCGDALQGTILRTSHRIRAKLAVPSIACITIVKPTCGMHPTPIGIQHDFLALRCATSGIGALLQYDCRIAFLLCVASLLRCGSPEKR